MIERSDKWKLDKNEGLKIETDICGLATHGFRVLL
jgi:hypothetical protein